MSLSRPSPSGSWKALQHDYSVMLQQTELQEYFSLTKQHQWLLLALCEYAKWKTRWFSGDTEISIDYDHLDAVVSDMIYRLMTPIQGADMFQLRQNEIAKCILEQSTDGGETWSIAFDYEQCSRYGTFEYNVEIGLKAQQNNYRISIYTGSPTDINQDCPTDFFDGDGSGSRQSALCSAIKHYIEVQILDTLNRYRVAAGLAALGAGALGLAGGILGVVIGGAVAGLVGYSLSLVEAAAADRQTIDDVICDLNTAMQGAAISEAGFQAAINGLTNGTGTRDTIVGILKGNMGATVNYLWFVDLLGNAFVATSSGYSDCPCEQGWCWNWDFTQNNGGWARVPGTAYGVWVSGTGWTGNKSGNVYAAYLYRQFASRVITKIYITIDVPYGSLTPGANLVVFNGGSTVLLNVQLIEGLHTYVWEGSVTCAEIRINPNDTTQNFAVKSFQFWGLGDNPIGTDNCTP